MNIIYLHAHDAGRFSQPYGYPVENPHLMRFAREGVLFRRAFCVAPTCGPSRSALLTGSYPHQHGMFGLPGGQGWLIDDYNKHLVRILSSWGYETALSGVQHEAPHSDFSCIGYQRVLEGESPEHPKTDLGQWQPDSVERVERYLAEKARDRSKPFFLSVGIDEPHRDNFPRPSLNLHGASDRFSKTRFYDPEKLDWRYTAPPPWLPDLPEIRKDMEAYWEGCRYMDDYMGRVIRAVDQHGLAEETLIIVTTDHGIEFPGGKKTLSDQGLGVMLLMRGPQGSGFTGGRVIEGLVSHLDLLPTIFELLGKQPPFPLEGSSLVPLVKGETASIHNYVYGEQTYHGGLEAIRSVRNERYKYVRRHDPVGPRLVHDGPTTATMQAVGHYNRHLGTEELYDLYLDPMEACNRVADPAYAEVRQELAIELEAWMQRTGDVFPTGQFPKPANW